MRNFHNQTTDWRFPRETCCYDPPNEELSQHLCGWCDYWRELLWPSKWGTSTTRSYRCIDTFHSCYDPPNEGLPQQKGDFNHVTRSSCYDPPNEGLPQQAGNVLWLILKCCYDPPNEGLPQLHPRDKPRLHAQVVMTLQMRDFHNAPSRNGAKNIPSCYDPPNEGLPQQ